VVGKTGLADSLSTFWYLWVAHRHLEAISPRGDAFEHAGYIIEVNCRDVTCNGITCMSSNSENGSTALDLHDVADLVLGHVFLIRGFLTCQRGGWQHSNWCG
jgi:hypothetical protein